MSDDERNRAGPAEEHNDSDSEVDEARNEREAQEQKDSFADSAQPKRERSSTALDKAVQAKKKKKKKKKTKKGEDVEEEVIVEKLPDVKNESRFKYCAGTVAELNTKEGKQAGRADYITTMHGGVKTKFFAYNMQWDSQQPDAYASGVGPKGGKRMASRAVQKWYKLRNRKKLRKALIRALAVMDSQASRAVFMRALASEFLIHKPPCGTGCGWAWRPFLRMQLWRRRTCPTGPLEGPPLEHGHTHIIRQKVKEGRAGDGVSRTGFCGMWLFQSCDASKRADLQRYRRNQFRKKERLRAAKRLQLSAGDVDRSSTARFFRPCTKCCSGSSSTTATFPNPHFVERDPNFPDVLRPNVSNKLLRKTTTLSEDHTMLTETNRMHREIVHKSQWAKPMPTKYVLPTKAKKRPTPASMTQDRRELATPAVYRRSKLRYAEYRPVDLWGRRNRSRLIDALVGDLRIRAGIPTFRRSEFLPEQIRWSKLHSIRDDTVVYTLDMMIRTVGSFRPNTAEGLRNQNVLKNAALNSGVLDALIALLEDECGDDAIWEKSKEQAYKIAVRRVRGLKKISREGAIEHGFYTVGSPGKVDEEPCLWICRLCECENFPGEGFESCQFCCAPCSDVDLRCLRTAPGGNRCMRETWEWQRVQIDEMCMCILRGLSISHLQVDGTTGISGERCQQMGNFFVKYPRAVARIQYYAHSRKGPLPSKLPTFNKSLFTVRKAFHDLENGIHFHEEDQVSVKAKTGSGFPDGKATKLISAVHVLSGRTGDIPESYLKSETSDKPRTPRERIKAGMSGYGFRLKDDKEPPQTRPRAGAPTRSDWIRYWANMLIGGSLEFKSMMHQFYPSIYKDVIKFWWTDYVEKGMNARPPDVDLVDFGLRHLGELFRSNEHVADLSNGYHLIKRREKTTQNAMDGALSNDRDDDAASIDEANTSTDEGSEGETEDNEGGSRRRRRKQSIADGIDVEAEVETDDDGMDPDVTNIVRYIETLYADAAKFEGEAKDHARQVIMSFYSKLAQASSIIPTSGAKLQHLLKNLRNIEAESALGSAGIHATIGVLHLNGVYTDVPPPALHENINTRANQLANVIPYTAKVYETNQVASIDRTPIWASDAFMAVAEGLKAPIVRAQLAKEDIIGVTFRFLNAIFQNEASGNVRAGTSGDLLDRREQDTTEALEFLSSAIISFHSPNDGNKESINEQTSAMFFRLHESNSGIKTGKPEGLNEGTIEMSDFKLITKDERQVAECCQTSLGRMCCGKQDPEIRKKRKALRKADIARDEKKAQMLRLDTKILALERREPLKPGMVKFIREEGPMNIERILDHFIMDATTRKVRAMALITKVMIWMTHRKDTDKGWPMWMVMPGLGRNVSSAKFCSIKKPLMGKDLSLNSWIYDELGAIHRDYDFAENCIRLQFADCPNARTLYEVATFPAQSHVAIIESHLWGAIRSARGKKWENIDLEGMVQVECTAREDVGMLGTSHVEVLLVFPATTVMMKTSRLVQVEAEFIDAVRVHLDKAMVGGGGRAGTQFLPFGAQQPPRIDIVTLQGTKRHVDTLICAPLVEKEEDNPISRRDRFAVRPRRYITRALQEQAASLIITRWRKARADRRARGDADFKGASSAEATYAKKRAEAMYKRSKTTAAVACQRVAEAMAGLINDEIELVPPIPPVDEKEGEEWIDSRRRQNKPEMPVQYRCLLEGQNVRRRSSHDARQKSEPPNPELDSLRSSKDDPGGNILEYLKEVERPPDAEFEAARKVEGIPRRVPLGVHYQKRGIGHPIRIRRDLAGITSGGQVRPRIHRTSAYWRIMTLTTVSRGGVYLQGGVASKPVNDMFTILQELMLEQAEVETLRHRQWKLKRGGDAARVVQGAKDKFRSAMPSSASTETATAKAKRSVREAKSTDMYQRCDEHVTRYLDASGLNSPMMLWSLAADIPPDDDIYSGITNDIHKGGFGGRLLVPLAVQAEGPATLAVLEEEQRVWLEERESPAHRNGITIESLGERANEDLWISKELQYIHGLLHENGSGRRNNARNNYPTPFPTNDPRGYEQKESKSTFRSEWRAKREVVNRFAPSWYDIRSERTVPRKQKHRLAPYEQWCPWEVTVKLDKYIQRKALSLMHEALGKCDELYSMFMKLNKTGLFVCGKCLTRDCKVEPNLFDRELEGQGAFAETFVAYPEVRSPENLFVYEGNWIEGARFMSGVGAGGGQGGKISGWIKWQARGRERAIRDPMLGGTVWARTYGSNDRRNIWIRHPKANSRELLDDFHTPLHEREFRVLIPCNVQDSKLREAVVTAVQMAGAGRVPPTGVIFRAKYIRSTRADLVRQALVNDGRPMNKSVPWDARTGPNQKQFKFDARADDRIELEFEEVHYVVRRAHETAFHEVQEPYPQCMSCWIETGASVSAPYFSKVASSAKLSTGLLNPCFSVFYADPYKAYSDFVLPAILNHPDLDPGEQLLLQQQGKMLSDWGAFTCGELLNPFMDNTGTKNVMNLSSAVQDTKNGKTATVGGKNGVTTKCQCDGLMHKCEKYQVAMALVRYVTCCREFKIRVGAGENGRIIHPVMLVKTSNALHPYQWSISDGCTRDSAHAMMHLYETLTAARTCKFVVPVTEGDTFATDPEAVFQLLASLDRGTFSKFDDTDVKNGNATPTVLSLGVKEIHGASELDTRTVLLNSCLNKALVDKIAPSIDAPAGSVGTPWYDCTIDFANRAPFSQNDNIDEKKLTIEYRKFHTVPSPSEGYRNDVHYSTYRKWFKSRRTLTLLRPDMFRPVKVAIDESVDLPLFYHAELSSDIYKVNWERITRCENRRNGRLNREYELRFLCDSISGRVHDAEHGSPFWSERNFSEYGIVERVGNPAKDDASVDGQYVVKTFRVKGKEIHDRDCIRVKHSKKKTRHFVAVDNGDSIWTITEVQNTNTATEIYERVRGCFGDVKKKVQAWQKKYTFAAVRVEPFELAWSGRKGGKRVDPAALVIQIHTANDKLTMKEQREERASVKLMQDRLLEQLNYGPRARGNDGYALATLPYGGVTDTGIPTWRLPQDSSTERHGRCAFLDTAYGKRFELPAGDDKLRVVGEILRQGDRVLTGCGDSDGQRPRIYRLLRILEAEVPGEPAIAEMIIPKSQQVGHRNADLVILSGKGKDEAAKKRFQEESDVCLHGFVQGGTNRYAGKFVKVVGKADEDPTVQVMADAHVRDLWIRWRELLLQKLREAESAMVGGESIDLTDVMRPREPLGANTVLLKLKTIAQGQDSFEALVEELTHNMAQDLSHPFLNMEVVQSGSMFQDFSDNPFQNSKRTMQEVVWKPLLEAAAVIRGVGRTDMKVHDHVTVKSTPRDDEEADPTTKKHTVKMVMFTQLTEESDLFDV